MRGKIIHKIAAAGACALLAASSCATASAFGHSYYLPEAAEMSITVPGDLITITRNASEGDSYFTTFHQDYAATMEDFQTNNIYLQGMDSSASLTVTVTMVESAESKGTVNYNQLSSEQLSEIAKGFLKDSSYTACRVDKSGKEVNWLQFDTNINGGKGLLANTVVDGKSVNVSMNRNGSDITADDSKEFASMISGVRFGERSFFDQYGMMILVAIAAILVVAVITMIILRIIRSRGGEKPTIHDENEKILEELAGKYARKPLVPIEDSESVVSEEQAEVQPQQPEAAAERVDSGYAETVAGEEVAAEALDAEEVFEEVEPREEQLPDLEPQQGELLGAEDIDVFADVMTAAADEAPDEDKEPVPQEQKTVAAEDDGDDDFFAGSDLAAEEAYETEAYETIETETPVRVDDVTRETVPVETAAEDVAAEVAEEAAEVPDETVEEAAAAEAPETTDASEAAEEAADEPEEEESGEEPGEDYFEEFEEEEEEPDEFEEYMNDEVLVRQDVKSNKFRNSSDFFDEAPRKSMGVINSRDLADAEEYDVIGEEEKRAKEVKREEPEPPKKKKEKKEKKKKEKKEKKAKPEKAEKQEKAEKAEKEEKAEKKEKKKSEGFRVFLAGFLAGCKSFFAGCKNFFTHCGYFIINVSRAIRRKHAKKKRKKAAEARRKRALQKAAEQRAQARNREAQARNRETQREKPRTNGGLVQVRSRGDRRPPSQSGLRRPSSQNAQRRPSSSRPPQKRRPSSSRPPQKRRPPSQSSQRRK